jgi:hypothetical protein
MSGYTEVTDEQIKTLFKKWNPSQIATFIYTAKLTDQPVEAVVLEWDQTQTRVKKALMGQPRNPRG